MRYAVPLVLAFFMLLCQAVDVAEKEGVRGFLGGWSDAEKELDKMQDVLDEGGVEDNDGLVDIFLHALGLKNGEEDIIDDERLMGDDTVDDPEPRDYMLEEGALPLELDKEFGEKHEHGEAHLIGLHDKFVCRHALRALQQPRQHSLGRQVHPKQHACVRAEFRVEEDLPEEYQTDFFQAGASYPTLVRWSTGGGAFEEPKGLYDDDTDFQEETDARPSPKAVAFKMFGAPGQSWVPWKTGAKTQDMLFVTPFIPFVRSVEDSWDHVISLLEGPLAFVKYLIDGINGGRGYRVLRAVNIGLRDRLTTQEFTAASAFRHGDTAAQYRLIPCERNYPSGFLGHVGKAFERITGFWRRHRFRHYLKDDLANEEGTCYKVEAIFFQDKKTTPVEPRKEGYRWGYSDTSQTPDDDAEFVHIATIHIPTIEHGVDWGTEEHESWCRDQAFNSWHTNTHRPLGSLERIRHHMYSNVQRHRQENQRGSIEEPTLSEFDQYFPVRE